jgi:hypothetical protein
MNDPGQNVHRLWREQPREEQTMRMDEIRSKAERFERHVRSWNLIAAVVLAVVLLAEAWQVWVHPSLLERVGDALTTAALVIVMVRFRPYAAVQAMPAGLGLTGSADFYRNQLVRQRDLADRPWRYLVLFVPGVGLSLFGSAFDRPPAQTAAIAVFGVALFLAVAWVNRRTVRKLRREIDELG